MSHVGIVIPGIMFSDTMDSPRRLAEFSRQVLAVAYREVTFADPCLHIHTSDLL